MDLVARAGKIRVPKKNLKGVWSYDGRRVPESGTDGSQNLTAANNLAALVSGRFENSNGRDRES
jgi:hypothetical protein